MFSALRNVPAEISDKKAKLTPEQRHVYASEKLANFRFIAKILASRCPRLLTADNLASMELQQELSDIGQFAEVAGCAVASGKMSIDSIYARLSMMLDVDYPLEGYNILKETQLVDSIHGHIAGVRAYVAYWIPRKQLIVAIPGTANLYQTGYDLHVIAHKYPGPEGCKVHAGFWKMYNGIQSNTLEVIRRGLRENEVVTLVITGHSMGGALAYLTALDVLAADDLLLPGLRIKLVAFGAPRCGNARLVRYWKERVTAYRQKNGADSFFEEYSVKAYNDGVPTLPPSIFGYKHFAQRPLYFKGNRLYWVPPPDCEYTLFNVRAEEEATMAEGEAGGPKYPKGGHNYYSGRDMEKAVRRMQWMDSLSRKYPEDWEERYRRRVVKEEREWMKEGSL